MYLLGKKFALVGGVVCEMCVDVKIDFVNFDQTVLPSVPAHCTHQMDLTDVQMTCVFAGEKVCARGGSSLCVKIDFVNFDQTIKPSVPPHCTHHMDLTDVRITCVFAVVSEFCKYRGWKLITRTSR